MDLFVSMVKHTIMAQWLNRWIHNPVFPGSNPGGGKVDSAFYPSKVGEMSSSIINAAQVCYGSAVLYM